MTRSFDRSSINVDDYIQRVERGRLLLQYPENPIISVNARFLDRVLAADDGVVLSLGHEPHGVRAELTVLQGVAAAFELAQALIPYTRAAPITDDETYEYTKTVLRACESRRRYTSDFVSVGQDPIVATDEFIYIGEFVCWISDAHEYALDSKPLRLPNGQVQAAIAMLAVAQWRRQEDTTSLRRRIAEYEVRLAETL